MNHALAQAIPGRELIELPGHGVMVRGTLHWSRPATDGRIGIAFLNSLSLPRTATGDSAVYWAECLANAGYPSFRLDLPGLGDSGGAIPVELLDYINAGEYAAMTAAKVKELVERFGLSGLVLAGHCAGTVTAMFAAVHCVKECKGLVLLDPYFHLPQAVRPAVRRGLTEWAMRSSFGGSLSRVYDRLRKVRLALRGGELPQNANKNLLHCWKKLASNGIPILFFKAPARMATGTKPRPGEFDYLSYVLGVAGPNSQVQVKFVEDTDHSFANRTGRTTVARDIKQWLLQNAPTGELGEAVLPFAGSSAANHDELKQLQLNCLHS
jgi:pimeloyl-ACP methyl ester carboxylesterase